MKNSDRIIIEAGKTERQYLRDLWSYHELFIFLAWRDILVRYKQTVFGVLWAIIRPFLTMVVFSVVFGKFAKMPSNGIPYPIIVYAAMLPWQFFANALQEASNSLITNQSLISKIYFPRIIIPISSVISSLVDFLIAFVILIGLMLYYGYYPMGRMLFLPLFLIITSLAAIGPGLYIAALNVKYRDFRYIIPFFIQFGIYISPVAYLTSTVPERWRLLYALNPMVGVIDGFRWCILGGKNHLDFFIISFSIVIAVMMTVFGSIYFRRTERQFADFI